ncbi:MAG TPA: hypothetical protein VGD42_19955, partial [Lysobacter sp.]
GSFTGDLMVDPTHLRDLRMREAQASGDALPAGIGSGSDRSRRMRDAVEAALSDIMLLGTQEQVRLAAAAATDLVAGRPIHTAELVVSLRDFIRDVLDLDPIPRGLAIPRQGPARPSTAASKGKGDTGKDDARGGGKGMGGAGAGAGMGMGVGLGGGLVAEEDADSHR